MNKKPKQSHPRQKLLLFLLTVCVSVGLFFLLHSMAGYSYPVPWEDEAVFVMQGKALADHGTMLAPSLNPHRVIEWMPPGYMVFLGGVLQLSGSLLDVSRYASLFLIIASFLILALMIWRNTNHSLLSLLILALCFASRHFMMAGNMARMEALILFLVSLAIYCFSVKKPLIAIAILVLSPIVHPNGLYFLIAGGVYYLLTEKFTFKNISTLTVLVWIGVIGAWFFYGLHIVQHWADFKYDMTMQMERKAGRNFWEGIIQTKYILGFSTIVVAGVYAWLKKKTWLLMLVVFAGASLFLNRIGKELWYEVFDIFAIMLLLIIIMDIVASFQSKVVTTIAFIGVILIGVTYGAIEEPINYRKDMNLNGIRMSESYPYVNDGDIEKVKAYILAQRKGNSKIRVKFEPRGDALLFLGKEENPIEPIHVHQEKTIFPDQDCDLYIVHDSKYFPPIWKTYPIQWALTNAGIDRNNAKYIIHSRDGTEFWYANSFQNKTRQ